MRSEEARLVSQKQGLAGHSELMHCLKRKHELIRQLIGPRPFCYLDCPVHENIGDLLIFLGTLEFFRDNACDMRLMAPHFSNWMGNTDDGEPVTTLVFHGGGNLGDLYDAHQSFRERMISLNHDKRIIILPQTIYFQVQANFRRACKIFGGHPDLHVCARDDNSLALARELTANAYLVPDMAHQLYPVNYEKAKSRRGRLGIYRTDKESSIPADAFDVSCADVTDWPSLIGNWNRRTRKAAVFLTSQTRDTPLQPFTSRVFASWWQRRANRHVSRAINLFASYDSVMTDRLHAHILSCLMDMPNLVHDNSYGKLSRYMDAWTQKSRDVTLLSSTSGDSSS